MDKLSILVHVNEWMVCYLYTIAMAKEQNSGKQ